MPQLKEITPGNQVRQIVNNFDYRTKGYFGGPPHSDSIDREINNRKLYEDGLIKPRRRIVMGSCQYDVNGNVIGYQSTTIMDKATPTQYEKEYIKLSEPLEYVQLKKLAVATSHWGTGASVKLLNESLELAHSLGKEWFVDVNSKNGIMLAFLRRYGILPKFDWVTPSGSHMHRLGR